MMKDLCGSSLFIQGHNDPQTKADRASQQLIISSLTKHFPQMTIRGEEVRAMHVDCSFDRSTSSSHRTSPLRTQLKQAISKNFSTLKAKKFCKFNVLMNFVNCKRKTYERLIFAFLNCLFCRLVSRLGRSIGWNSRIYSGSIGRSDRVDRCGNQGQSHWGNHSSAILCRWS